jgi:hypothetical protein
MDFLKYEDKKSKSLGGFEKKSEIIKEAVKEVPAEKDEFGIVIKEAIPAIQKDTTLKLVRLWMILLKNGL